MSDDDELDNEGMLVARIVIERRIYDSTDHPDQVWYEAINPATGEDLAVVEQLGMLTLCQHTALAEASADDDEDDD